MPVQAITAEFFSDSVCDACGSNSALTTRITSGTSVSQWLCRSCEMSGVAFVLQPTVRQPVTKQMKRTSDRQELKIAKAVGGQKQKASGSMAHAKSDVRKHGVLRVEAKYTQARSYTVKLRDLEKIRSECVGREEPAFQITFMDNSNLHPIDEWVLIPFAVWRRWHAPAKNRRPVGR